jgi:hypothetical protein
MTSLLYPLIVAAVAISQTTIVVTDENDPKKKIDQVTVTVRRKDQQLAQEKTGTSGVVVIEDTSGYDGSEVIQAVQELKPPQYNPRNMPWPLGTDPIRLALKKRPCTVTYTVYKPVMQTSDRGGTVAMVQALIELPCELRLELPAVPPPPGHIYQLTRVDSQYDSSRGMTEYRPFYIAVPAAPVVTGYFVQPHDVEPCACE